MSGFRVARSDASEQDDDAAELQEAEEVVGVALVAGDEPPEAQQPGEEPLDAPPASVPSELSSVLGHVSTIALVGCDHVYAPLGKLSVERIAVIRPVTDETFRQRLHESGSEGVEDERSFMALTTRNPDGDRKTVAVCHCHDLGRLATSSSSNQSAPLFAPAWLPSM